MTVSYCGKIALKPQEFEALQQIIIDDGFSNTIHVSGYNEGIAELTCCTLRPCM